MRLAVTILLFLSLNFVYAESVQITFQGQKLNANLQLAEGKSLHDGVIMMTHGTLAHNKMEIMAALQSTLAEYDINSLAINLSLGLDDRPSRMYDCQTPHRHQHSDALGEIGAWLDWLKEKNAQNIVLLGHSRGGNQTAWYLAEHPDSPVQAAILIAPATWDANTSATHYAQRYQQPLKEVLNKAEQWVDTKQSDKWLEDTDFMYCPKARVTAASFVSYYGDNANRDTPTVLRKLKLPVLVIMGSEDTNIADLPMRMASLKEQENVQQVMIDGADHFFRDLYIEDVVSSVETFLETLK